MKPFTKYNLSDLISERKNKIINYIKSLDNEMIISGQDETIVHNLYEEYKFFIVEIGEEIIEKRQLSEKTIKTYNRLYNHGDFFDEPKYFQSAGVELKQSFYFKGDSILFGSRSNTYSLSGYPDVEISENVLTLSSSEDIITIRNPINNDLLFDRIKNDLSTIKKFMNYNSTMAIEFNNSIKTIAQKELDIRKEKIDSFHIIAEMLEIPIDVKKPKIVEMVEMKREIRPLISKKISESNYTISDDIYESILGMIRHVCSSFESTPSTYEKHDEEGLRDIILSHLNGVFQGKATSEAFRKSGKTDIKIEFQNRSAFVAECKMWSGFKSLEKALKQLFSYTTWRDTKLSLIIFSKNKNFINVLNEISQKINNVEYYISHKETFKNEYEVKFSIKEGNQFVDVRIFAFDLSTTPNVA